MKVRGFCFEIGQCVYPLLPILLSKRDLQRNTDTCDFVTSVYVLCAYHVRTILRFLFPQDCPQSDDGPGDKCDESMVGE